MKTPSEISSIKQLDFGKLKLLLQEFDFLGYGFHDSFPDSFTALTTVPVTAAMRTDVCVPVFAVAVNKLVVPQ